jgi:threonine/homoserine/homoserine lactone efflux protein
VTQLALALAVGVALGALTGLPLGVVNVAIVEAAARRGARAASGIAVGGALADGVHAALAFGGVGHAIVARPAVRLALHAIAGVVLLAYAVVIWRAKAPTGAARDVPAPVSLRSARSSLDDRAGFGRGALAGLGLTLPNVAALGAWIAVAAALPPTSVAAGLVTAAGVAAGSAAFFLALARLAARGSALPSTPRRTLTRGVAVVLACLGVGAISRAAGVL